MTLWFVYILRSTRTNVLYTGVTKDPERRLRQHNTGQGAKFTRGKGPWVIGHVEPAPDKGSALRRELEIKTMTRAKKLELLAQSSSDFPGVNGTAKLSLDTN